MRENGDTDPTDGPLQARSSLPEALDDGVDVTLIRWMLALSPEERLRTLENTIRAILRLRDAQKPS